MIELSNLYTMKNVNSNFERTGYGKRMLSTIIQENNS